MTFTHRTFDIDLRDSPQPLAVQLDAAPLERLLADAELGHRLYELALLDRPGDVWEYLDVVPRHLPPPLAARLDMGRTVARNALRPWPDHRVPFDVFDREARAEPGEASEAWTEACEGDDARGFVRHLFEHLRFRGADAGGELGAHERARIATGAHPFSCLTREQAIAA